LELIRPICFVQEVIDTSCGCGQSFDVLVGSWPFWGERPSPTPPSGKWHSEGGNLTDRRLSWIRKASYDIPVPTSRLLLLTRAIPLRVRAWWCHRRSTHPSNGRRWTSRHRLFVINQNMQYLLVFLNILRTRKLLDYETLITKVGCQYTLMLLVL